MKTIFALLFLIILSGTTYSQDLYWQKINYNFHGRVTSLGVCSGTIIFATAYDKVFRSTDHGNNWEQIPGTDTIIFNNIYSMCFNNLGKIFLGSDEAMYVSSDGGSTWDSCGKKYLADANVYSIKTLSDGSIFAGSWKGIYKSEDNGQTWVKLKNLIMDENIALDVFRNDTLEYLYAGTFGDGVYRSRNYGSTWERLRPITDLERLDVFTLAVDAANDYLLVSTRNGLMKQKIFRKDWETIKYNIFKDVIRSILVTQEGYYLAGTWYTGAFASTDMGKTWKEFNNGLEFKTIYAMAQDNQGYIYVSSDDGLYVSAKPASQLLKQ